MRKKPSPEGNVQMPDSLFQLIKSIFTGIIKNFPRILLRMLIISIISFAVVMAVNFYVIAVINNGDQKPMDPNSPWYYLANLENNRGSFTAISFLFFFLISSVIEMILDRGFFTFIKDIITIPKWTFSCFKKSGLYKLPVLFTSMGISMFLYITSQNKFLYMTCILILLTIYMTRDKNFLGILVHAVWQDIQRIFMRKKEGRGTNIYLVSMVILGFIAGILILYILPYDSLSFILGKVGDHFPLVIALIMFIVSFLLVKKKISPKTAVFLIVFAFANLIISRFISEALAHDGGWQEGGANWNSYIRSAGSSRVISSGRKPGLFASAGAWLGNMLYNGYSYTADTAVGAWNYAARKTSDAYEAAVDVAMHGFLAWGEAYDSAMKYMSDSWNETSKYFTDKWKEVSEYVSEQYNYALDYLGHAYDFIKQDIMEAAGTIYDTAVYLKDLGVNLWENPAIFWETCKESWATVTDAYNYTADLAKNLWENPAIFGEFFKQSWDITKDISASVYDTVTSPAKLFEFAKDLVGYNNFVNSIDPNRSLLSRLEQTTLGVVKLGATLYTAGKVSTSIKNTSSKLLGLSDDAAKVVIKPPVTAPKPVKPPVTPKPPATPPKPIVPSAPPTAPITAPLKIDPNKINHIFGPNKIVGHKLEPFAKMFNNDMTKAFDSLQKATLEYVNKNGITGVFKDVVVRANGVDITVRGSVVNGVMKLGTAFVP